MLSAERRMRASIATYALVTLALGVWAAASVIRACHGEPGAPLDDTYIHFQFAQGFARFDPLRYSPAAPRVAGATSWLWPVLLVPTIWAGGSGAALLVTTWVLGFAALFGQACEALLVSRRFLSAPAAFAAGLLVLAFSANTWFAASGMETVLLGYVLLRSARRAAEYWEGSRSRARIVELLVLALAATMIRPEGGLAALFATGVLALGPRRQRPYAVLGVLVPFVVPLLNWVLTGSPAQTGSLIKWLPLNPYYEGVELWGAMLGRVRLTLGMLLDGRGWALLFIPEGSRILAYAGLIALPVVAWRRGAKGHGVLLTIVGLGILLASSYEAFHTNRLRYLWPFSAPWLIGLASLGELVGELLARFRPAWLRAGLIVPALCGLALASKQPESVADLAASASAVTEQHVSLGRWARKLPQGAMLGVNDAGAIAFLSRHRTFDIVGLTTAGEARYWVAGAGSRFEHYEQLQQHELPTHFIVYPHWFRMPSLLGPCLTERVVRTSNVLGGSRMVACQADYTRLDSGSRPVPDVTERPLLAVLDVANLESEARKGYELGKTTADDNVVVEFGGWVDGGRQRRQRDAFWLSVAPGGLVVVRLGASRQGRVELSLDGLTTVTAAVGSRAFEEVHFEVPGHLPRPRHGVSERSGESAVTLESSVPITVLHYWSYGRPSGNGVEKN